MEAPTLGNLFHCLSTSTSKTKTQLFIWHFSLFQLLSTASCSVLSASEKSLVLSSLVSCSLKSGLSLCINKSLHFFRLNSPSFLSLHPVITFMDFYWACFSTSMSLLYCKPWHWTQHSRCCLTSVKEKGRIMLPDRLATTFLMQPRLLWAFFMARAYFSVIVNFLYKVAFQSVSPQPVEGVGLQRRRSWHFPLLNSIRFLLAHFIILLRCL